MCGCTVVSRALLDSSCSPVNKALLGLNINRGAEIRIRLRDSESTFFPYEHVLGTMLHELAHMARGPHDAQFYAVLDELTRVRRHRGSKIAVSACF